MRILYAIQGTGNGHLARAAEIYPELIKYARVDVLISGYDSELELPFPVRYKRHGFGFAFGKKGGYDWKKTISNAKPIRFVDEIIKFPIKRYDFVINDFEPISAWAAKITGIPCYSLSHQSAVMHPNSPKPKRISIMSQFILRNYAPCKRYYGFHFDTYADNIFTPVIRQSIRKLKTKEKPHVTVYLPSYSDQLLSDLFQQVKLVEWHVFSKRAKFETQQENVKIYPVNKKQFENSMAQGMGVICGAGFETPSEALFLNKNLLVIPMKGQYEQLANAAALEKIGIPVLMKISPTTATYLHDWLLSKPIFNISYPDQTDDVIRRIMTEFSMLHFTKPRSKYLRKWKSLIPESLPSSIEDPMI